VGDTAAAVQQSAQQTALVVGSIATGIGAPVLALGAKADNAAYAATGREINWVNWSYKWLLDPGRFLVELGSGFRKPVEHGKALNNEQRKLAKTLAGDDPVAISAALTRIGGAATKLGDCSHATSMSACARHRDSFVGTGLQFLQGRTDLFVAPEVREDVPMAGIAASSSPTLLKLDSNSPSNLPDWLGGTPAKPTSPSGTWSTIGNFFAQVAPVVGQVYASKLNKDAADKLAKAGAPGLAVPSQPATEPPRTAPNFDFGGYLNALYQSTPGLGTSEPRAASAGAYALPFGTGSSSMADVLPWIALGFAAVLLAKMAKVI
jgi:hypothetical protein